MNAIRELSSAEDFYDVTGYGFFISQMPGLRWVGKLVKPSKKKFYCSDAVVYCVQKRGGIKVSPRGHNHTAPVDILLYALKHHRLYSLKSKGETL